MKAKEMFEELGFKYIITPFSTIECSLETRKYPITFYTDTDGSFDVIRDCNVETHKAIHQQLKELGWIK
jgi:hypothetical protein